MSNRTAVLPIALDLSETRHVEVGAEGHELIEHVPVNSIDNTTVLEFNSIGYGDKYKSLSDIFLRLRLSIVKKGGEAFKATDLKQPRFVNNILFSLFRGVTITVNNQVVLQIDNYLHLKEFIEIALNVNKTIADSRLQAQGFVIDGKQETLAKITENSKNVEFFAKLNFFSIEKYLIDNCSMNIKLFLENPAFYLKEEDGDGTGQLKLLDARIFIKHISPSHDVRLSNNKAAMTRPIAYEGNRGMIIFYTAPAGLSQVHNEQMYSGLRPSIVLFGQIPNSALAGDRKLNALQFGQNNLYRFNYVVNGIPQSPFTINTQNGFDYSAHAFSSLYNALGYSTDKDLIVNFDNFKTDYFLLAIDAGKSGVGVSEHTPVLESCTIGFSAQYSKPLKEPLTLFLYLEVPMRFDINSSRQVNVKY